MPEMTPQELRKMADITADCMRYFLSSRAVATSDNTRAVMQQRANTLRSVAFLLHRVAAKELVPAVHAHCIDRGNDCFCSNCNSPNVAHGQRYCPNCGALMDGKP